MTRLPSSASASWSEKSEICWRNSERRRALGGGLVLEGDAAELEEVLDPPLRLDRPLGLERLEVAALLEHLLEQLGDGELERAGHQRLQQRVQAPHGLERCGADAGLLGLVERLEERDALRVRVDLEPRDRRVADAAARPVGDARERDAVERVVDHLQVRDGVLDLGALVEARAADHLVGDLLADEHVLQHARLGVRPVEDRDLGAGVALVDQPRDLGGDVARLRVLVLDLDHAHRLALPQLAEEVLGLALAVVRDQRVRGAEDRVRRAVVLLERDRLRAAEVALELEDVADVGAAERVDRLVGVADREDVPVLAGEQLQEPVLRVVRVLVLVDEDVAEGLLPLLARVRMLLEHLDGAHDQVVEVHRVRGVQAALVAVVDGGHGLLVEGADALRVLLRADELVLGVGDLVRGCRAGRSASDPSPPPRRSP